MLKSHMNKENTGAFSEFQTGSFVCRKPLEILVARSLTPPRALSLIHIYQAAVISQNQMKVKTCRETEQ